MMRALKAEFLKIKRSRMILWTSITVLAYAVLATVLNITLLRDGEFAKKVATAGGAFKQAFDAGFYDLNWTNQLRVAVQGITGTWGILVFGLVTAYVFGREYKECTSKNLLTIPVRREYFVAAKLIVVACWVFSLTVLSLALHTAGLALAAVPGFGWDHIWKALVEGFEVTLLLYLTLPLVAWIAMLGRGYGRAMLFSFGAMMVGNGLAPTELSRYFPWNMPLHLVGASWMPMPGSSLVPLSWLIALAVFIAGTVLVMRRVDVADDTA